MLYAGNGHAQIKSVRFSLWSAEDIARHSVCKIDSKLLYGPNSVSDSKMGRMENDEKCATCGLTNKDCVGHFGMIELNTKIVHPLFYKFVIQILKCFCWECSCLLVSRDRLELLGLLRTRGLGRLKRVMEHVKKVIVCPQCKESQPLFAECKGDGSVAMYPNKSETRVKQKRVLLTGKQIARVFENIATEDAKLVGLSSESSHPRNLIMTVLPVLPPRSRPYIVDNGKPSEDDLTYKYPEIVKQTHRVAEAKTDEEEARAVASLEFHIRTLFDNSKGKAKLTKERPMKSIKQRLTGKDGLLRNNLMGKRVDESWRTVIGPDPTLRMDEIVVPEQICKNLRFPEVVFDHNKGAMMKILEDGKARYIIKKNGSTIDATFAMWTPGTHLEYGDIVVRDGKESVPDNSLSFKLREGDIIKRKVDKFDGKRLIGSEIQQIPVKLRQRRNINLDVGDKVMRELREGDWVLINRQPTQ